MFNYNFLPYGLVGEASLTVIHPNPTDKNLNEVGIVLETSKLADTKGAYQLQLISV